MNIENLDLFASVKTFQEEDLLDKDVVIIDVLRASSTIITALHNGAKGIIPVADLGSASQIAHGLDSPSYLLCGEKDGNKIEGCDLGNSPLEYTSEAVKNKTIILNTTNGTRAIKRSHLADEIYIAGFLNLSTVAQALQSSDRDAVLVCAGWRGHLSLEDLLCAGNIIYELTSGNLPEAARDGIKVAFGLYEKFGDDIESTISSSSHARRLKDIIGTDDLTFCSQVNTMNVLPKLDEGIISDFYGKE